jgi:hypothetical protein
LFVFGLPDFLLLCTIYVPCASALIDWPIMRQACVKEITYHSGLVTGSSPGWIFPPVTNTGLMCCIADYAHKLLLCVCLVVHQSRFERIVTCWWNFGEFRYWKRHPKHGRPASFDMS